MDELIQRLLDQKTIQPRFRLALKPEQAESLLFAAYAAEVRNRDREFKNDKHVAENIRRLARFLTCDTGKFGVLLCGTYGNGKTTLLYAFQNALAYLNSLNMLPQPYCKGIQVVDAVTLARECAEVENFNSYKNKPLLALEDIGRDAEKILVYGTPVYPITDILEYRYAHQLFTFITTNLTAEELRAKYGQRVCDRFNEMEVIIFNKKDSYRREPKV